MRKEDLPFCDESDSFKEVVSVINKGRLGLALVGNRGRFLGIITDGDIRRAFDRPDFQGLMASDILTKSAKTVRREMKLADAEELMTSNKVSSLVVVDACEAVVGVLQIYDLEIG